MNGPSNQPGNNSTICRKNALQQQLQTALAELGPNKMISVNEDLRPQPVQDLSAIVTFKRLENGNIAVYSGRPSAYGTRVKSIDGTFHQITGPAFLGEGDIIKIGDLEIPLSSHSINPRFNDFCFHFSSLNLGQELKVGRAYLGTHSCQIEDSKVSRQHCTIFKVSDQNGQQDAIYQIRDGIPSTSVYIDGADGWYALDGCVELGHGRQVMLPFLPNDYIELEIPAPYSLSGALLSGDIRQKFSTYEISQHLRGTPVNSLPGKSNLDMSRLEQDQINLARLILTTVDQVIYFIRHNQVDQAINLLESKETWEGFGLKLESPRRTFEYENIFEIELKEAFKFMVDNSQTAETFAKIATASIYKKPNNSTRYFESLDINEKAHLTSFEKITALFYLENLLQVLQNTIKGSISKRLELIKALPSEFFTFNPEQLAALDRVSFMEEKGLVMHPLYLDPDSYLAGIPLQRRNVLKAIVNYCETDEAYTIGTEFQKLRNGVSLYIGLGKISYLTNLNSSSINCKRISISPPHDNVSYKDNPLLSTRHKHADLQISPDHIEIKQLAPGLYNISSPQKSEETSNKYPIFYQDPHGVWRKADNTTLPTGTLIRLGSSFEFTLG